MKTNSSIWTEALLEVTTFLSKLKYALEHEALIVIQMNRTADLNRSDYRCTNRYTLAKLFPDEDPKIVLRRELKKLTEENYLRTLQDEHFPERGELREFGMIYDTEKHVYLKIRAKLTSDQMTGSHIVFVLSFHFAEHLFKDEDFPYKKK